MSGSEQQQFTSALESNLSSGDSVSIPSAVSAFTRPIATAWTNGSSESDIENKLWEAWGAAIKFAASTSDIQQDGLVQTIRETLKIGAIRNNNGQVCKVQDGVVWSDLPVFGASMREAWNPNPSDPTSWKNKNAFAARLTNAESKESPLDFSLYSIWSNRTLLESQAAANSDWSSTQDIDVQASCVWFTYAAQALLRLSNAGKTFDGKVAKAGDGYPDQDWNGLCTDRWILWKENLQSLQDSGAQSSLKDTIQAALDAINYAETNSV